MNGLGFLNKTKCAIIGMIHLPALPGTPFYKGSVQHIVDRALKELDIYMKCDLDAILVENMNDVPYIKQNEIGPEITATMTRVCNEIRLKAPDLPCGIQILAGCNKEALSVALACNLQFIRCEGFVFTHIADEGIIDANAGSLLRYRKHIGAEHISIFTDIKKKHSSHAITSDVSLVETAHAAEFFQSDGLILTGTATGRPADRNELNDLMKNTKLPILVGSGITKENVNDYLCADALIIGSYFKKDGNWKNKVDINIVKSFMDEMKHKVKIKI